MIHDEELRSQIDYSAGQREAAKQHVQGMKALKATGGNFAFLFDPNRIRLEGHRTDGCLGFYGTGD